MTDLGLRQKEISLPLLKEKILIIPLPFFKNKTIFHCLLFGIYCDFAEKSE